MNTVSQSLFFSQDGTFLSLCTTMELGINAVSGKWNLPILWNLSRGATRLNQLRRSIGSISVKSLSRQLKDLEEKGIIHRRVYPEVPPKVEYSLSDQGLTLIPILKRPLSMGKAYQERA